MSDFTIRLGQSPDYPLVYNATANTFRFSPYYIRMGSADYTDTMNGIIARLLERWTLLVAVVTKVPDEIAGFVLCKPGVAACSLYVKQPYRRMGVARMLLEAGRLRDFAAVLGKPDAFKLAREKGLHVQFSPYFGILEAS